MLMISNLITTSLDGTSKVWSLTNGLCLKLNNKVRLRKTDNIPIDSTYNKHNNIYSDQDSS